MVEYMVIKMVEVVFDFLLLKYDFVLKSKKFI